MTRTQDTLSDDVLRHQTTAVLKGLLVSMRPHQWTKNLVLFAAVLFVDRYTDPYALSRVFLAFALFCALSGAVYLINDIRDAERDREHPTKRSRPIASGAVPKRSAGLAATFLGVGALAGAAALDTSFAAVAASYTAIALAYTFALRDLVIVDLLAVSAGFVLRVVAGAVVIHVETSPWILICTLFLALLLSLGKRRQEIVLLEANAGAHRRNLMEYSVQFLDYLMLLVTAGAVMSYLLYALASGRHGPYMGITIPFVLYGILRYLYLAFQKGEGGSPAELLLQDRPLLANAVLWVLSAMCALYLDRVLGR
ncbi:MAG: decaprenyl-phosphate phosphoribosyltransferase [Armatimonadota bacterium]